MDNVSCVHPKLQAGLKLTDKCGSKQTDHLKTMWSRPFDFGHGKY